MDKFIAACVFSMMAFCAQAQDVCAFIPDTMSVPGQGTILQGDYIETTLKNQSEVRFFRAKGNKLYLRMIVTENFYFDKVDMLEIRSETKSFYAKNTRQHKVSKTKGLYIVEIFPNYLSTLKEYGITGIAFGQAETRFTRQDARQVKAIASCLHSNLSNK
jgi:hypothetical protein